MSSVIALTSSDDVNVMENEKCDGNPLSPSTPMNNDISICNISVNGVGESKTWITDSMVGGVSTANGIYIYNAKNVSISRIKVFGCATSGIKLFNCPYSTVSNSEVYDCRNQAIVSGNSDGISIVGCHIHHIGAMDGRCGFASGGHAYIDTVINYISRGS